MVFLPLFLPSGSGTYTTSSLSTKTTSASDPPNICKVKPQQLQVGSSNFSQLGCVPSLLPQQQQQQTPQVFVSQSAAGEAPQSAHTLSFSLLPPLSSFPPLSVCFLYRCF